jgi:hypothetical protein
MDEGADQIVEELVAVVREQTNFKAASKKKREILLIAKTIQSL